jgi:hypothetical protein
VAVAGNTGSPVPPVSGGGLLFMVSTIVRVHCVGIHSIN